MEPKKLLKRLILPFRFLVSFGILIYLIKILDWQHLASLVPQFRLQYIWIAPILLLLGFYCLAIRWCLILPYFGVSLSTTESFIYYLVGNFYNILMPGAIGGDVIRIGICAVKQKKPVTKIATTVFLERVFGLLIVLLIGTVALLSLSDDWHQKLGEPLTLSFLLFCVGILGSAIASWLLLRVIPLESLKSRLQNVPILSVLLNLFQLIQQIPLLILLTALFFNFLSQAFDIIASYFLAKTMLIELPLLVFFVVIPIVYLSTALPISLGGLGVREGVLAFLLAKLGIANSDAVSFSLLLYLNRVLISLIGGIIQFSWHLPVKKLK